jgi:hypothetical protein
MRRWRRTLLLCLLGAWLLMTWWQARKPLPPGLQLASAVCTVASGEVEFIADISAADAWGHPAVSQAIFDAVLTTVRAARRFVVLDYRAFGSAPEGNSRSAAAQLTDALLERRRQQPGLSVLFITDPASEDYGAQRSPQLQLLRAAGVTVVSANLDRLRDSNPWYSSLWRLALRWSSTPTSALSSSARRLNFKADSRRLILADDGHERLVAVIGSADPADAETLWSNVALRVAGGALPELLDSELAVARFSGWRGSAQAFEPPAVAADRCTPAAAVSAPPAPGTLRMQVLTESAIGASLLARLAQLGAGDGVDVAMQHVSERTVIEALLAAARRGALVRLLLDPNENAASGGTSGIPNQPVASELVSRSNGALHVRWYRTHGERFHAALVMLYDAHSLWLSVGSAQLTRRSLDGFDLEANVALEMSSDAALAQQARGYFDTLWDNRADLGIEYTADFAAFADPAQSDYWLYRLMEGSGFAPF